MSVFLVAWTIALALLQRVGAYNVSQIEISALHDLFTATNGNEWAWKYPLSSFGQKWNFSTPVVDPCNGWQGVTCTSTNYNFTGTVTSLNLKQYNLQGTIPSSISGLANLTFLDMDNNFLKSSIPNSIVSIPELSQLRLSYNDLTGHLPLEFFLNTSNLVYFSLTENYISGPLPDIAQGHSLMLTQMFFNGNALSGTIPENIGSFANLIVLFIADNNLSGTIPESIYDLVLLNRLALNGNDLHGIISSKIGQMVEMRYIYLHQCNLHGTLPDTIGGMYKLVYITFFINQLTGPLTTGLCNMTRLHAIAADTNYLTGSIPECFGQLTLMEQVNLYSNYLTGTMPSSLAAMTQLQIMLVQDNDLYGDPAPAFDRTTQLSLESVDLSSNQFSGALPVTVFGPALVTFAAFDTCFDGAIPEEICQAKQLESLALDGMTSRCALRIWPSFPNSPKVVTEVAGSVPHCVWSGLPNLTTLHLSSNSLTGTIPSLATYNNLTDLDLSFNLFSGSVPATLLGWHTLMNLNLKSNCFCGTITGTQTLPFAYHDGDKGTTLTLSGNRFSGIIPLELQAAIKMDIVDGNMFSCQYGHFPPYSDPNGTTYICGSNLLYVSLATLAGVLGVISMALLLFSRTAYRSVRDHDMAGQEKVPFRDVVDRMKEIYSSLPKISALLAQIQNSQDANLNDQVGAPSRSVYYKSLVVTLISWKTQVDTLVRVEDTKHAQTMYLGKILKTSLLACEDPTLDCSCNELRSTNLAQLQSANVPHLVQFLKSLHLLRRIALLVFVAQILYTFPAYPILKYYYGTFLYQYGWYMSGAFISGVAAAIAVIAIWFVTLTIVLYVIVRFIPSRKALIYRVALQSRALELLQMYNKLEPDGQDNNRNDREAMRELAAAQVPVEMPQETYSVMNILPTALTLTRTLTVNRTPEDAGNGRGSTIEMSSPSGKNQLSTQPGTSASQTLPRPRSDVSLSTNVSASSRSMRSTDNDSVSSCQSGVVKRRDKTVTGYLSQWFKNSVWISMMALLLNVVVVLSIKGAFVYLLNSNETSFVLKIGIEFALSAVDLMWGVMFVPVIITRLPKMKPSGRMMLKIGLLYFNSVIAPCLAIMFTESACLKGMFVKHTSVQELFNFSYCALYDPFDLSSCLGKAIWESELHYTPPFIYNFNCYSNVISAYTPIFIFSYCILALSLPLASMYITTLTKRRWYRGVVPGIFWVERPRTQATPVSDAPTVHPIHTNNNNTATEKRVSSSGVSALPAGQKIQTPKKRGFRPSSFLFFPGFILASTIHHILVLLTFGLMLPELGFAVVVVVFITTLTWEIILGRYLSRSPHCDPSKWQDPEESIPTTEVCPISGKIISKNSSDDQVKQDYATPVKASPASNIVAEQPDCSGGLDRLCIGVSCCPRKCKALLAYGSGIVIAFAVLEMVADKYAVFTSLWAPITCILLPAGLILYLKWQRVGTLDQAAYEASCAQQATTETMMLMRQTLVPDVTDAGTNADEESVNALNDSRDSQDDV